MRLNHDDIQELLSTMVELMRLNERLRRDATRAATQSPTREAMQKAIIDMMTCDAASPSVESQVLLARELDFYARNGRRLAASREAAARHRERAQAGATRPRSPDFAPRVHDGAHAIHPPREARAPARGASKGLQSYYDAIGRFEGADAPGDAMPTRDPFADAPQGDASTQGDAPQGDAP